MTDPINLHNADTLKPRGTPLPKHHKAYSTGELSVFIISAALEGLSKKQNARAHIELQDILCDKFGHTFIKPVIGSYKDVQERSFVVNGSRKELIEIAAFFGQESILWLDSSRRAFLIYIHSPEDQVQIGRLVTCTEEEAKAGGDWTFDRKQDQYYRVV